MAWYLAPSVIRANPEGKQITTRCESGSRLGSELKSEPKTVRNFFKSHQCAMSQSVVPPTRGEYPFRHKR